MTPSAANDRGSEDTEDLECAVVEQGEYSSGWDMWKDEKNVWMTSRSDHNTQHLLETNYGALCLQKAVINGKGLLKIKIP